MRPGGEGKGESCTRIRGGATRTNRHPDVLARSVANVLGNGVNDTAGEVALGPGLSDQTR